LIQIGTHQIINQYKNIASKVLHQRTLRGHTVENIKSMVDHKVSEHLELEFTTDHTITTSELTLRKELTDQVNVSELKQQFEHMDIRINNESFKQVSKSIMNETTSLLNMKSRALKSNLTNSEFVHTQHQNYLTSQFEQELSDLENRNIKPIYKDYVRQPAQNAPKVEDKPADRPRESAGDDKDIQIDHDSIMKHKLPEINIDPMQSVDVDAIFEQVYKKFEKRISFEKRRRGL